MVNRPQFRKLECTSEEDSYCEVELAKDKIRLDLHIQLGYMILQYAKLRMLEFYYDLMDVYVERSRFEMMETDTDSMYMAISGYTLIDVIKPSMQDKLRQGLTSFCDRAEVKADNTVYWFPRTCCEKHAKFDKRTSGLFKLEYEGARMIGICSKSYIVANSKETKPENRVKFSVKRVNKHLVVDPLNTFRSVLQTGKAATTVNLGFRPIHNIVFTYTQEKIEWNYFYVRTEYTRFP